MTETTSKIVTAALAADATIPKQRVDAAMRTLRGEADATQPEPRVVRTPEACRILGVHKKTLRAWSARGVLTPCFGANPRQRIGYTAESVRAILAGRKV